MTTAQTRGSKYAATQGLDITAVAAMLRAELTTELVGFKVSVRVSRYSMGQSVTVEITAVPAGFVILNSDAMTAVLREEGHRRPRLTGQACDLLAKVEGMVEDYNRSETEFAADYSHSRFYAHVDFGTDALRADWIAHEEREAASVSGFHASSDDHLLNAIALAQGTPANA
jgi:hypothetical protein